MNIENKAMSIRLPADVHRRLRALYVETGQSMNSMVNEAVQQWLDRREAEKKTERKRSR